MPQLYPAIGSPAAGKELSIRFVFVPRQGALGVNAAVGSGRTITGKVITFTHPPLDVTVRVTLYDPAAAYVWQGLCAADELAAPDPGSPKFQLQVIVPAEIVDWSVKQV